MAELLLSAKADVNAKNSDGVTALHVSARYGNRSVAEALVANGADVNAKDNSGRTPLHSAVSSNGLLISSGPGTGLQKEVAELLLAKGADVNARDSDGETPLRIAAGFLEIDRTANPRLKDMVDLLRQRGGHE